MQLTRRSQSGPPAGAAAALTAGVCPHQTHSAKTRITSPRKRDGIAAGGNLKLLCAVVASATIALCDS
jgi:hypothetical protein